MPVAERPAVQPRFSRRIETFAQALSASVAHRCTWRKIMDRKTALLLGAAVSLSGGSALAAAPTEPAVPAASSYSDLLQPITNPIERLARADSEAPPARLIEAQYYQGQYQNHHHHHHHHHNRRWYMQRGYYWYGGAWVLRPRHHHHHHHHHHSQY
jgi:hypothetical protein